MDFPPTRPPTTGPIVGQCGPVFEVPLRVAAVLPHNREIKPADWDTLRSCLAPGDELFAVPADQRHRLAGADLALVLRACGDTGWAPALVAAGVPVIALYPHRGFHPFQSVLCSQVNTAGGTALPADLPEIIDASIRAVRARLALRGMRLLAVEPPMDPQRSANLLRFARAARTRLGLEILFDSTEELQRRAAGYTNQAAAAVLQDWYARVFDGPGEMAEPYMRQCAKLYLAEKQLLAETGAVGITVDDIGGFLLTQPPAIMPNLTYGALVFDGYLAAEEGDIGVLASELLLYAGLGTHPTMSNLYYAYRDQFSALADAAGYTRAMELADARQCFADNHVVAAHFSASGVLPPNLMQETRYRVRQTLPSWPGQAMMASTPKLGPVILGRLAEDLTSWHVESGEVDKLGFGDQYGWYRGRWMIHLPDAADFARRMTHPHYAIAADTGRRPTLEILTDRLLGLKVADTGAHPGWSSSR